LKSEPAIERQILEYFAAHPAAQDTLRGVVEWWLLKQRIVEAASEVEAALGSLVAEGKLSAQAGPDGQVCYRLKPENHDD
jgi:hypothetical protein